MADTKKTIELEFNTSGQAKNDLQDMLDLTRKLYAQQMALNQLWKQGGPQGGGGPGPSSNSSSIDPLGRILQQQLGQLNTTLGNINLATQGMAARAGMQAQVREPREEGGGGLGGIVTIAKAWAAFHMAGTAAQSVAHHFDVMSNSMMTATEKANSLVEAIPLIGGVAHSFRAAAEAYIGVPEAVRSAGREHQVSMGVHIPQEFQQENLINRMRGEEFGYLSQAAARREYGPSPQGPTARTTAMEQIQYREYRQTEPARDAQREAQIRARASAMQAQFATLQHAESKKYLVSQMEQIGGGTEKITNDQMLEMHKRRVAAEAEFYKGWDKMTPEQRQGRIAEARESNDTALARAREVDPTAAGIANAMKFGEEAKRAMLAVEQEEKLRNEMVAKTAQAVRDETAARQAGIEVMRSELGVLRQREQTAVNTAHRLGGMTQIEQGMAAGAFKTLQGIQQRTGSIANVPHFLRERARQFAPQQVGNWEEQAGIKAADRFRQGAGQGAVDFRDKVGDLRPQVDALEAALKKAGFQVQIEGADRMANVVKDAISGVIDRFVDKVTAARAEILSEVDLKFRLRGQANQGG